MAIEGLEDFRARIGRLSAAVREFVNEELNASADEFVDIVQAVAPVGSPLESHPGELRESVKKVEGDHAFQVRIIVAARDPKGEFYAAHVEHGHRGPDGAHVPAYPFFFPAYRLFRASFRKRMAGVLKRAVALTFPGG